MTFAIQSNPTFEAQITLIGQAREQVLNVVFRNKIRSEQIALIDEIKARSGNDADLLFALIESWDADQPISIESLTTLEDHQPGAIAAILSSYNEARMVARKKN